MLRKEIILPMQSQQSNNKNNNKDLSVLLPSLGQILTKIASIQLTGLWVWLNWINPPPPPFFPLLFPFLSFSIARAHTLLHEMKTISEHFLFTWTLSQVIRVVKADYKFYRTLVIDFSVSWSPIDSAFCQ